VPNDPFGDFPTPPELARAVLDVVPGPWGRILEPTCGTGTFLAAARERFPGAERRGVEIQEQHAAAAREFGTIDTADALRLDFAALEWAGTGPLLVVGNPPWVTNAGLTVLGGTNRAERSNQSGPRGIDALTGASNFDLAEALIVRLITQLADQAPTLAVLCKTHVARAVLQRGLPIREARIHRIDARRWFGAQVDACLFVVEIQVGAATGTAMVLDGIPGTATHRTGMVGGRLVADVDAYRDVQHLDGTSHLTWRQGVKHDAAAVMELRDDGGTPVDRDGRRVTVEPEHLYPLLKGTDVFRGRAPSRWLVVPQHHPGEDTARLRIEAPQLWAYLQHHDRQLQARRSAIYRNRPPYSVFGVGPYTFAPWKVVVSGLHREARFRLVGPHDGRPVTVDDTCYLLPFDDEAQARQVHEQLTGPTAQRFLHSLTFPDAKRPITKALLQRLDLGRLG
jgi:hypothetical protein